jgi:hypothetical protein
MYESVLIIIYVILKQTLFFSIEVARDAGFIKGVDVPVDRDVMSRESGIHTFSSLSSTSFNTNPLFN